MIPGRLLQLDHLRRAVAEWHDHNHWLHLALRDQVVEDDVGFANRRPPVGGIAEAVQQIEDGILRLCLGIEAGRSVHIEIALVPHDLRLEEVMIYDCLLYTSPSPRD